jgi:hypothetical protein
MRGKWTHWGAALAASLAIVGAAWAAGPSVWGKTLLQSTELPSEVLGRFAVFNLKPKGGPGVIVDSENWAGEPVNAASKSNPYRIVVTVFGVAEKEGEVSARVDTAWNLDGSMSRVNPSPYVRKQDVQAGERVQLVTASGPISFKEDRTVVPAVAYAGSRNLKIDGIRVEVWSGFGKTSWLQMLQSWAPLLTGVIFLAIAIWWRRR